MTGTSEPKIVRDLVPVPILRLNAPDHGDDPNNRYDCMDCASAPEADEWIALYLDAAHRVLAALCLTCLDEHAPLTYEQIHAAARD